MECISLVPSVNRVYSAMLTLSAKIMVASIVIALLSVVVFCVFLCFYIKWCWLRYESSLVYSSRRHVSHQGPPAVVVASRGGVEADTLESLPVVVYNPKDFKEELQCAVCLNQVSTGEKVRLLPECNHGFHVSCIDMWLHSHSTCPLCRSPVVSYEYSSSKSNNTNSNYEFQETIASSISPDLDSDDDDYSDELLGFVGKFVMI